MCIKKGGGRSQFFGLTTRYDLKFFWALNLGGGKIFSACIANFLVLASLHQGEIPDDRKYACVVPVFKKCKAKDMDNYRPISILPTVSKLLERVVHTQLCDYLSKYNIIS